VLRVPDMGVPHGIGHVSSSRKGVLVIGRVFVADDSDVPAAHDLARQIRLTPAKS
jgi:hypothetical protein